MLLSFLLLRGPVMFRELPGQDEDFFAVPGMTILESGVPRIPYLPSRDEESAFYRADEMLFALPPLHFYLEAIVYCVFEPSTGFARLTSTLAGLGAIVLLYLIGRRWFGEERGALLGAGFYACSRALYFPCLSARPDMLFGFWGLATLWCMTRWHQERRTRDLVYAGLCIGGGFLTHPAAIIYAFQAGCWCLLAGGALRQRITRASILTLVTVLVSSLWLILIVRAPELFWSQFGNNVLNRGGSGLVSRMLMPLPAIQYQGKLLLEMLESFQLFLVAAALVLVTFCSFRRSTRHFRPWIFVIWGGIYWHLVFQGTHPTKGYWCFTAAPVFLMLGGLLSRIWQDREANGTRRPWDARIVVTLVFVCFLPGSGLRSLAVHLREWNNPVYDAGQFTEELIAKYPKGKRYLVDRSYVFAFYRAGREPLLASWEPFYFDATDEPFDYLIGGPSLSQEQLPLTLDARLQEIWGDCGQPGACCARVYVPDR
ncbi:MAG: glycosyltransferase family 39 protein [Planctomycetaceae bacterium]|nr:glycosyltransferase family 39 protein [Planctomycetaceae bacterium]